MLISKIQLCETAEFQVFNRKVLPSISNLIFSMNRRRTEPTAQQRSRTSVQLSENVVVYSSYPQRVEDVPVEYQAAVYAKNQRKQDAQREAKERLRLDAFRSELRVLKAKLRDFPGGPERLKLDKEIRAKEKSIKKAPKPRGKWSPVFAGSFESGKR